MKIGSLFSGIGWLELGLERSGLGQVEWQAELDPFALSILENHWPSVTRYSDVRHISRTSAPSVDVLCGGFPCTDLSHAAHGVARTGLSGSESGLWFEMLRIIGEFGPRVVVVENVATAWKSWLPVVRSNLFGIGYSSLPLRLRAADVGAPHGRPRVFVVAYPHGDRERYVQIHAKARRITKDICDRGDWVAGPSKAMGVDDDGPHRMDPRRRRAIGNAVVPQCSEVIGRAIVECLV